MRMLLWPLMAGFISGAIAITPARAFENWSGPGYYLLEDYYPVSGPYSNEADCQTALAALPQDQAYETNAMCDYEATEPDADGN